MAERTRPEAAARTWDGLEIAPERPTGSTVVVRRTSPTGDMQLLLLHRNARGPDYEGDWAWTTPAGARQPGEAVYPAALRELAEEAGLTGLEPWAVDLSGRWAVFAVDVRHDVDVDLVDPEHDRCEWLTFDAAARRVLPAAVAAMQRRAMAVPAAHIGFRRMGDHDFRLVAAWQSAPHVARWWDAADGRTEAEVRLRYAPRLHGDEPVRMWVVEVDGRPVGFVQDYQVAKHDAYANATGDPEAIAFDYAIGESDLVGRGLGTRVIWEFCRDVLVSDFPDAPRFLASPSHRNTASIRTLEKCGFERGRRIRSTGDDGRPADDEVVCTLDVRHWFGPRPHRSP